MAVHVFRAADHRRTTFRAVGDSRQQVGCVCPHGVALAFWPALTFGWPFAKSCLDGIPQLAADQRLVGILDLEIAALADTQIGLVAEHGHIGANGMLPSIAQIGKAMEEKFVMEDWHNFGPYYDRTLLAWHKNFNNAWPELKEKYGERFKRMWNYYLLSSAGGFRSRSHQLWQIVMTRRGTPQPECRFV